MIEYLIAGKGKFKPCCVCGAPTRRLNIFFESYICSEACETVMNNKLIKAESVDDSKILSNDNYTLPKEDE